MPRAWNTLILIAAILGLTATAALADTHNDHRFSLSLGAFITDRDTEAALDGTLTDGTPTDFEKDLGLDSSDTVFRIDGYFKINERHRIDFSVFDLSRDASRQITRDIQWGDTLYAVDNVIETDLDLEIYKLGYTYSFVRSENGYLGGTAGLYVADSRASLAEESVGIAEVGELTAPLPVIGLRGQYALSDRWSFRASGEFFFIEYDNIDGSLVDVYAGLDYHVLDFLSIGLGFNSVTIDVDTSQNDFQGGLDWQYSGGLVFFKFDF